MKKILSKVFVLLLFCLLSFQAKSQTETMFSQYMFNETFINPAYTGSRETISATLFYRKQWVGIEGAPVTQSFSVHAPIKKKKLGLGLSVLNEEIGVSHKLLVYGGVSYRILYQQSALSFGLNVGFINDEELYSQVRTIVAGDRQFSTDVTKMFLPNAGFGVYYYKSNFYAGFSIPKLIQNNLNPSLPNGVENNIAKISAWHYYLTAGYVYKMNELIKVKPSMMFKATKNAPVQLDINADFLINDFFWLGAGYRTGDAVNAMVGLDLSRQLRISYSYDFTVSSLQKYNTGSHEFGLKYQFIERGRNFISSPRYF